MFFEAFLNPLDSNYIPLMILYMTPMRIGNVSALLPLHPQARIMPHHNKSVLNKYFLNA